MNVFNNFTNIFSQIKKKKNIKRLIYYNQKQKKI